MSIDNPTDFAKVIYLSNDYIVIKTLWFSDQYKDFNMNLNIKHGPMLSDEFHRYLHALQKSHLVLTDVYYYEWS